MSRLITLWGYAVIAAAAVGLEVVARRSGHVARFSDVLSVAVQRWFVRFALLAGWLWLGWHLFVRVDWR